MAKSKGLVKDVFMTDLPEDIQYIITDVNKMISNIIDNTLNNKKAYDDLKSSSWAMSCLKDFKTAPSAKGDVGSARIYKRGNKYDTMIQVTGHFRNHQYGWIEELLHDFVRDVHQSVKTEVRKRHKLTIKDEGTGGDSNEGFDLYLSNKQSKELWDKFEDRKAKFISESFDLIDSDDEDDDITNFNEKSHVKLKFDYRKGYDVDTGHKIMIVYSLDNINITFPGHAHGLDYSDVKDKLDDPEIQKLNREAEQNIAKKGNLDHQSYGQKILAIKDLVTNKTLKSCRYVGLFDPDHKHPEAMKLTDEQIKYAQSHFHIFSIKVGDVETEDQKNFKSSKAYKMNIVGNDNLNEPKITIGEKHLKSGRGAKLDDIDPTKKPITYNHPSAKDLKKNPDHYTKEDVDLILDAINSQAFNNEEFDEKSHGKLKYSFRMSVNYKNGHFIKIVFDLKPEDISQVGTFDDQDYKNFNSFLKDKEIIKNINKNGSTNFSGTGTVMGIVDMDTHENLKTVSTIGILGGSQTTFEKYLPKSKYYDRSKNNFGEYLRADREKIAAELNLNPPDAITYTVGEKCKVPVYRSTLASNTINAVFNNEHSPYGKGVKGGSYPKSSVIKSNNWHGRNSDISVNTAIKQLEKEFDNVKAIATKYPDLQGDVDKVEKDFDYVKKEISKNVDEKYGQSISNPTYKYYHYYLKNDIDNLKLSINHKKGIWESIDINLYEKDNIDFEESADNSPAVHNQGKRMLAALSKEYIGENAKKINQYGANTFANIITKNLLPSWGGAFRKLSIQIDTKSNGIVEFKIPTMSIDFISRYINGREPLEAFLHRVPEIKIRMSADVFNTMKDPNDAYNFFLAAVKYYDIKVNKYANKLMAEAMRMDTAMKHLISTTKLSGLVSYSLQLLFIFDKVDMSNNKTFEIDKSDIDTVNKFFRNIYTSYADPEKEKNKVLKDLKDMVSSLTESCEWDDNIKTISYLPEEVGKLFDGKYNEMIKHYTDLWYNEQIDWQDMRTTEGQLKYIREKFGVKKLKKIPKDIVAYIQIETEAIETSNDKMMIASYCLSKLEIVEWYIELIDTDNIVPHTRAYLVDVRTQLLKCYKEIMDTKIDKNAGKIKVSDEYYI
jgi:hypothetical protein